MTTRDLSLILVSHHSSRLLPAAIGSFRREAGGAGLQAEVVVVEQSEDATEQERVAASGPDVILPRPNRGYAAGVNAGIAAAHGRLLLVANPDVELGTGALVPLLTALAAGWDVVAPQLELAGFLFPPADVQTPAAEAARRLALRGRGPWQRHLVRELRRWQRVWEANTPQEVPALSGAVLAFSAALAARLGPWDEGYFLYFEETDWLRRARRRGARLGLVAAARAVHRWGHAADPEAWAGCYATSQGRYYRRWFPLLGPLALRLPAAAPPAPRPWSEAPVGPDWRWLLSPSPAGFPAAQLATGAEAPEAAAAFCEACGRPGVTLLAWAPGQGRLAGPFAWAKAITDPRPFA